MFGLAFAIASLSDDLSRWWSFYKIRREAREAADRLVRVYEARETGSVKKAEKNERNENIKRQRGEMTTTTYTRNHF